jgi:hypothetical protein
MKKNAECTSGKQVKDDFERTMAALFRVPKSAVKDKPKSEPKSPKSKSRN